MAFSGDVALTKNTWTLLTASDVTAISFQVKSIHPVFISATVGAVAPSNTTGAWLYDQYMGELARPLSELSLNQTATRVYAYSPNYEAVLSVQHA